MHGRNGEKIKRLTGETISETPQLPPLPSTFSLIQEREQQWFSTVATLNLGRDSNSYLVKKGLEASSSSEAIPPGKQTTDFIHKGNRYPSGEQVSTKGTYIHQGNKLYIVYIYIPFTSSTH